MKHAFPSSGSHFPLPILQGLPDFAIGLLNRLAMQEGSPLVHPFCERVETHFWLFVRFRLREVGTEIIVKFIRNNLQFIHV